MNVPTVVVVDNGIPSLKGDCIQVTLGGSWKPLKFRRSPWSSIVEAGCEYGRVVGDLCPDSQSLSYMSTEPEPKVVHGWGPVALQKLIDVWRSVESVELKQDNIDEYNKSCLAMIAQDVCKNLGAAAACHDATVSQHKSRINWGRIVLMSARFTVTQHADVFADLIEAAMTSWNASVGSGNKITIDHCEVIFAQVDFNKSQSTSPLDTQISLEAQITRRPKLALVEYTFDSEQLLQFVHKIAIQTLNLKCVRVTGLDMKKSGDKASDRTYDVKLFCARSGSSEGNVVEHSAVQANSLDKKADSGATSSEKILNKIAPTKKARQGLEMVPVSAIYRVTPIDMLNNATLGLVKFLLSGSKAYLNDETEKRSKQAKGNPTFSHILINHGGALFLHCLDRSHTLIDSVPPIETGVGAGALTKEYRTPAMIKLLQKYVIRPTHVVTTTPRQPQTRIQQDTEFFPLIREHGFIFEFQEFAPIVEAFESNSMTAAVFENSCAMMSDLNKKKRKNDPYVFGKLNKSKLRSAYKQIFSELTKLALAYRKVSPNHQKLATHIVQLVELPEVDESGQGAADAWEEVDVLTSMTEREKDDMNRGDINNQHFNHTNKRMKTQRNYDGGNPVGNNNSNNNINNNNNNNNNNNTTNNNNNNDGDKLSTYRAQLISFQQDHRRQSFTFAGSMTSSDRKTIHEEAEKLGLQHSSRGSHGERQLVVWKKGGFSNNDEREKERSVVSEASETATASSKNEPDKNLWSLHRSTLDGKDKDKVFAGMENPRAW